MKRINIINIELSNRCNFLCEHCSARVNDNENRVRVLTHPEIDLIITELVKNEVRKICISIGEPFLYPERLKYLVNMAKKFNIECGVVTNGFFATSVSRAKRILKDLPIKAMDISYDRWHEPFTNIQTVKNLVVAAQAFNIEVMVRSIFVGYSNMARKKEEQRLRDIFKDIPVKIEAFPMVFAGRALRLRHLVDSWDSLPHFNTCAIRENSLVIDCEGYCYPCCSGLLTFKDKHRVTLGNIFKENLHKLLEKFNNSFLVQFFHKYGPAELLRILEAKFGKESIYPMYTQNPGGDSCFLCWRMFHNPFFRKLFPEGFNSSISKVN